MNFANHFTTNIASHLRLDQADRYQTIQDYSLDAIDAALPLSRRLSQENRWTLRYTQRAIEEYKKFVFLSIVAGHPITPSVQVDQVWHLHLIYTRSYWDDFCPNVLGKSFHHGPTKGGRQENQKYLDWYGKTLASYERIFGYPAPIDIWSSPDRRFGHDLQVERVNLQDHWVISKGWIGRVPHISFQRGFQNILQSVRSYCKRSLGLSVVSVDRQLLWLASAFMLSLTLAGCSAIVNPFEMIGSEFLGFYAQLIVFGLIWGYFWRWFSRVNSWTATHTDSTQVTPYELAYLVGKEQRVIDLAVAGLVKEKLLEVSDTGALMPVPNSVLPSNINPIERSVFNNVGPGKTLGELKKSTFAQVEMLQSQLIDRNLILTENAAKKTCAVTSLIAWSLVVLGVLRLGNGVLNGRPVGYLIAMLIGLLILASGLWIKPIRTRNGDRIITRTQRHYKNQSRTEVQERFLIGFALSGVTMLTEYPNLANLMSIMTSPKPTNTTSDGYSSGYDSGGSSDSSSDGDSGGGCGGCGGCGE